MSNNKYRKINKNQNKIINNNNLKYYNMLKKMPETKIMRLVDKNK